MYAVHCTYISVIYNITYAEYISVMGTSKLLGTFIFIYPADVVRENFSRGAAHARECENTGVKVCENIAHEHMVHSWSVFINTNFYETEI